MNSHRRDPYLWLHLAGLATVPLWLDVCLAGLAIGEPVVPPWLELAALTLVGTLPIIWMQLRRPFYVFSVPGLALRPDKLSPARRRLLAIQRSWWSQGLVVLTAVLLWYLLYWLYQAAPMVVDLPWFIGKTRSTGWAICAGGFLLANLFALVPATVMPLLMTSHRQLMKVSPLEADQILSRFTVLGLRLGRILPEDAQSEPFNSESATDPLDATDGEPDIDGEIDSASVSCSPIDQALNGIELQLHDPEVSDSAVSPTQPGHPVDPFLSRHELSNSEQQTVMPPTAAQSAFEVGDQQESQSAEFTPELKQSTRLHTHLDSDPAVLEVTTSHAAADTDMAMNQIAADAFSGSAGSLSSPSEASDSLATDAMQEQTFSAVDLAVIATSPEIASGNHQTQKSNSLHTDPDSEGTLVDASDDSALTSPSTDSSHVPESTNTMRSI